jgi:hypothetical protein
MIRKQFYIEQHHNRMLKRRARERGVTESALIREALDAVQIGSVASRRAAAAARKALAFMRSLSALPRGATREGKWTRASLYEERIGRLAKS